MRVECCVEIENQTKKENNSDIPFAVRSLGQDVVFRLRTVNGRKGREGGNKQLLVEHAKIDVKTKATRKRRCRRVRADARQGSAAAGGDGGEGLKR